MKTCGTSVCHSRSSGGSRARSASCPLWWMPTTSPWRSAPRRSGGSAVPVGLVADVEHHLDHPRVVGQPLDLAHRAVDVPGVDVDRAEQPVVALDPVLDLPVVVGGHERGLELDPALLRRRHVEPAGQDPRLDVVQVEHLLAQQAEVRPAGAAVARLGVRAVEAARRRLRVGQPLLRAPSRSRSCTCARRSAGTAGGPRCSRPRGCRCR